jgi:hypothetical protein
MFEKTLRNLEDFQTPGGGIVSGMFPSAVDEAGLLVLTDFETGHIVMPAYEESNRISKSAVLSVQAINKSGGPGVC